MSQGIKPSVDTSSEEFTAGVEAGLNSEQDTENWRAGNELGQELKAENEPGASAPEDLSDKTTTPLFIENAPGGDQGNLQDEKDETEE